MSGYVEVGYTVTLVVLAGYGVSLLAREGALRRRLGRPAPPDEERATTRPDAP